MAFHTPLNKIPALLALAMLPTFGHTALVDDFDGDTIDFSKWRNYSTNHTWEVVRDVDSAAGELVLGAASDGTSGFPTGYSGSKLIVHDDPEESLQARAKVTAVEAGSSGQSSTIAVEGNYYNADSDTPSDFTGDVWASTMVGDWGSGLEARYEILKSTNADFTTWDVVEEGTISTGPLTLDTFYDMKVDYDGDNGFTFTVAGNTESASGPARAGEASTDYQRLSALVQDGDDPVSITGRIDNVVVNDGATLYDDFSDDRLDSSLWDESLFEFIFLEEQRHADNGKLHLDIRGDDLGDASGPRQRLILSDVTNPDYLEAKVSIPSDSELDNNVYSWVGISGYMYNRDHDGSTANPYNELEGDVWAIVYLEEFNGEIIGGAWIEASTTTNHSGWEKLFNKTFPEPLSPDTEYKLSLAREGNDIVFGLGDEELRYPIEGSAFEPSPDALDGYRAVRTSIGGTMSSSDGGIARGTFDDVRTDPSTSGDDGDDGDSGGDDGSGGDSGGSGGDDGSGDDSGGGGGGGGGAVGLLALFLAGMLAVRRRLAAN